MTTEEFKKEFEALKGQMVLYDDKVYHFIGIGEDDHDFFYILVNGDKFMFGTLLAPLSKLKGILEEYHYKNLVHTAKYNWHYSYDFFMKRSIPEEQFRLLVAQEKQMMIDRILAPKSKDTFFYCGDNKIIGELYWEFN